MTVTMPKWEEVTRRGTNARTFTVGDSPEKGRAFLQEVAAVTGGKVKRVKRA